MRNGRRTLLGIVGICALPAITLAEDLLNANARGEILSSLQTWEERMSHVEGTFRRQHTVMGAQRKVIRSREKVIQFKFNGQNRRVDFLREGTEEGKVFAFSVNTKYRFFVAREDEGQPYLLRGLDLNNKEELDASTFGAIEHALSSPFALSPGVQPIRALLADPSNSVSAFDSHVSTTGETLRVLTLDIGNRDCPVHKATIHLDPHNDWCIREYEALDRNGSMPYRRTISYEPHREGVLFPRNMSYEFYADNEEGGYGESLTDEFTDLSICKAPERLFMLSAYGLPEPGSAGKGESWLTATTLLLIGAALAASGCFVLWRNSRLRRA